MTAPTHHGVVAIVTNPERSRFFIQRKDAEYRPSPRGYSLFGGAIEDGEDPAEAITRELAEELGPGAARLAAPAPVFIGRTMAAGFLLSLFEIVVDDDTLGALADAPVFEGECGVVLDREALLTTPLVSGLGAVVSEYLEAAAGLRG